MFDTIPTNQVDVDLVETMIARRAGVDTRSVVPFADFVSALTAILRLHDTRRLTLISAGHLTPEVEIAADRAEIKIEERPGESPFVGDVEAAIAAVGQTSDIIYVANPNRVTGADFSLADLERMAEAVPKGLLIADEQYFEFYGISASQLIDRCDNVLVLRSFTSAFGIVSSEAGYLLACKETAGRIREELACERISLALQKTMLASLLNDEAMANRLTDIRNESLRLTLALTRQGIQSRLTATDFILIRVADCAGVGNCLTKYKLPVENLSGYPAMSNYLRYRIQSHLSNDRLLRAFEKMPQNLYRMKNVDRREIRMRSRASSTTPSKSAQRVKAVSEMVGSGAD
ncbi:MAG: aminotransferase class I/II-fold pyridoxal phosphate-dependent enzyme [Candidatus Zixiibacteriota bacterium]